MQSIAVGKWMSGNDTDWFNTSNGRALEFPSANMNSNAWSMNTIADLMANRGKTGNIQLLSEEVVSEALSDSKIAYDGYLNSTYSFTKGGFSRLSDMNSPLICKNFREYYDGFYGWCGLGGGFNIWNISKRVGVSYCVNGKTPQPIFGPRGDRIMKSVQAVLQKIA